MFLSSRSLQAEYFDSERPSKELRQFFECLSRMNRLFGFAEPFQRFAPGLLGDSACACVSVLDLGSGDGSLGRVLTEWASRRGWKWSITNLDINLMAMNLHAGARGVAASALALPFQSACFDLVIASQMLHHLEDSEARQVLSEAWRVARKGILISDLHRSSALYLLLWVAFQFHRYPETFRADGLLSVKRSWRINELRELIGGSELEHVEVKLHFGARIVLLARKAT